MDFFKHPSNNHVFGAPSDWDQGGEVKCEALPVTVVRYPDGTPAIESFWRPSEEELAALNARGCLVLSVFGRGMPPVSIGVLP